MKDRLISGLLVLSLLVPAIARAADTVVLTTLEWPPYTASGATDSGTSAAVVTAALAVEGVSVRYVFLPWNRAIDTARHGGADGFFPAYARPPNPDWTVSNAIGTGPIYFVERRDRPISWSTLDDLGARLIGVDASFINTPEIDRRLADGRLHGDASLSDDQNLSKLANRRVDLAIIDANVFAFLLAKPQFAAIAPLLRLQPKPLETKVLFVDFRNDDRGRRFRDLLNRGLAKLAAAGERRVAGLPPPQPPQ